jgi:hypothetical protein
LCYVSKAVLELLCTLLDNVGEVLVGADKYAGKRHALQFFRNGLASAFEASTTDENIGRVNLFA